MSVLSGDLPIHVLTDPGDLTAVASPAPALAPRLAERATAALERFAGWLDAYGPTSYDPYDLWASPIGRRAKALYHRGALAGKLAAAPFVALDAFVPSSRRLLARKRRYAIADAHYAMGFLVLHRSTGDDRALARARAHLEALERARCPGYRELCWGYPFDWETHSGTVRAGSPLITVTPYGYEAFELADAVMGERRSPAAMRSVAEFALRRIPDQPVAPDVAASSYTPFDRRRVVNASAYRGFLLTAAGLRFDRADWLEAGARNLRFVVRSQRDDGAWPYSADGLDDFVDNFHTCLVLKNLAKAWSLTGDTEVAEAIRAGFAFYRRELLDAEGRPLPFARSPRPTLYRRDLYDLAEGINVARLIARSDLGIDGAGALVERLVEELVGRWALEDGHFATRELLAGRNTVPYHRWAQSQAFHALARTVGGD